MTSTTYQLPEALPRPGALENGDEDAAVKLSRFARLVAFDDRLLRRLVQNRRSRITFMLRTLCRMYDPDMVIMGVAVALFAPGFVRVANYAAIALTITSLLVLVVKRAVRRRRPALDIQSVAPPDRFSFPSGHTAAAFALAIAMFGAAPWLAPGLLLLAMCVAYGRMYLGVHYPLDVAAGAGVGLLTGSLIAVIEWPTVIELPFTLPGL